MSAPLRVGIVGAGAVVRALHGPAFDACPDAELVAIASRDRARAAAVAEELGILATFPDVDRLLDEPEIDAVSICTPPHLHRALAERAVAAGKHVLLEKPVAHTLADVAALAQLARTAPVVVELVRNERFMELHEAARRAIDEGRIGEPRGVMQLTATTGPDDWTGGAAWPTDPAQSGGGVLLDLGVHKVDLVGWLLRRRIVDVASAVLDREPADSVEWTGALALQLEDGVPATVTASWRGPADAMQLVVAGTDGVLEADGVTGVLSIARPDGTTRSTHVAPWSAADRSAHAMVADFVARCRARPALDRLAADTWDAGTRWVLEAYRRRQALTD